jgi:hypothetical protein
MVSLRHPIMAEGAWSSSGARQRLSRPLQFEHLRVEHQVNGFLGCDYNISICHLSFIGMRDMRRADGEPCLQGADEQ